MASATPTVQVEMLPAYNAIKMTWFSPANKDEASAALRAGINALDNAHQPMILIVELAGDTQIPPGLKVSETLLTFCKHPMLAELLMYGTNTPVRAISRRLTLLTGGGNVHSFETEAAVWHYMQQTASDPIRLPG